MRRRFALWKTKYQRVTGYVSLGTFLIVLIQFVKDIYMNNYLGWKPDFPVFLAVAAVPVFVLLVVLAELDWHFVFQHEQEQANVKNPLMYPMVVWTAFALTKSSHHPEIEQKLRKVFKGMDAEGMFDEVLKELRGAA